MMQPLELELNWRLRCHGSEKLGSVCVQNTFVLFLFYVPAVEREVGRAWVCGRA